MTEPLTMLVKDAQDGNRDALEQVIRAVQDRVHRLAIRMLFNRDDAAEATQEILIRIVTKLSTFLGESSFETWVYRISTNYLLTTRKVIQKERGLTFDLFQQDLESGLIVDPAPTAEDVVLLNELRVACTMAMLLCLDPGHRLAYILGEIFELDHAEAAYALDLTPDNYRQRLSRARRGVIEFTAKACGLASENAKCRCERRLPAALALKRISTGRTYSDADTPDYAATKREAARTVDALKAVKLQRAAGAFKCPTDLAAILVQMTAPPN